MNEFLETSDPDVIAAGDSIENHHFVTGKPVPIQLRGPAVIQGRLAAKRLAGHEIAFPGVLGNCVVKLFSKCIRRHRSDRGAGPPGGLRYCLRHGRIAQQARHDPRAWRHGRSSWSSTASPQRLLGGQIISDAEAPVKEIDAINALILSRKTIPDLTVLMNAGNPDCSSEPSAEPITIAAEQALQQLKQGSSN